MTNWFYKKIVSCVEVKFKMFKFDFIPAKQKDLDMTLNVRYSLSVERFITLT